LDRGAFDGVGGRLDGAPRFGKTGFLGLLQDASLALTPVAVLAARFQTQLLPNDNNF